MVVRSRAISGLLPAMTILGFAGAAHAGLSGFAINLNAVYLQTSISAPSTPTNINFFIDAFEQNSGDFTNASITNPGPGSPVNLTVVPSAGQLVYSQGYTSLALLHDDFLFGTYTVTAVNNVTMTSQSSFLHYTADLFSTDIPALTPSSYNQVQGINPTAPFVVNISSSFIPSPSASESDTQLILTNSVTGTSASFVYPSTSTALTIPANTLLPNTKYTLDVAFVNSLSGTSPRAGFTSQLFSTNTDVPFTTGNAVPVQVLSGFNGGPLSHPVALSGTGIAQLSGTIGGFGSADFYRLSWQGGEFTADAAVTGAKANGSYDFELFNANGGLAADQVLNAADDFATAIDEFISPSDYIIGIVADAINDNDPNFTIIFDTPIHSAVAAAPEPDTLALLIIGLTSLLCVSLHRRMKRCAIGV